MDQCRRRGLMSGLYLHNHKQLLSRERSQGLGPHPRQGDMVADGICGQETAVRYVGGHDRVRSDVLNVGRCRLALQQCECFACLLLRRRHTCRCQCQ